MFSLNLKMNNEIVNLLSKKTLQEEIIKQADIEELPLSVQHWLTQSGIIDEQKAHIIYLRQEGLMKFKPEQKDWMKAKAEQYFTVDHPSFIWRVKTSMLGVPVVGRDLFTNGIGKMQIKIAGMFPVVNIANNIKINEATIQRYLGEIIWFPSAALSPYIEWESIGEYTAKATMSYGDTTGSVIFEFSKQWDILTIKAYRYKDVNDDEKTEWIATIKQTSIYNGLRIPSELEAAWILDDGKFTWYKFKIVDVQYNQFVIDK